MRILTFASTKGGVGKSTTAALVADSLLRRGDTVRLVDFDEQNSVSKWAGEICERNENLRLTEFKLPRDATVPDYYNLMLDEFEDETDWVVIDTKGADDAKQLAALAICDLVLAPSGPIDDEVTGIEKTLGYFRMALAATGEEDTDPKSMLRVIYQRPAQFPNEVMLGYEHVIHDHYGAVEGLHRSSTISTFIGNKMTTDEAIELAKSEKRDTKAFKKIQQAADRLTDEIIGEFDE